MADATLNDMLARGQRVYGQMPATPEPTVDDPPGDDELPEELPDNEVIEEPPVEEPAETVTPEPPIRYKYASQEEAERAYAEAERRMHEATAEAARLRQAYDERMREWQASQTAKPPEPEPPKAPVPAQRPGESLKDYIGRLRDLDINADTYEAEMEDLWVGGFTTDPRIQAHIDQRAELKARELVQQELEAFATRQREEQAQQQQVQTIQQQVMAQAEAAGIPFKDDPYLVKYFWEEAAPLADRELPDAQTMDEKIAFALQQVKTRFRLDSIPSSPPAAPAAPVTPSDTPPPSGASELPPATPPRRAPAPMARQSATVPSGGGNSPEAPPTPPTLTDLIDRKKALRRI